MRKSILTFVVVTFFAGCSYPVKISPWNGKQYIPSPVFTAYDDGNEDQRPVYSHIKVYERDKPCSIPYCPLVWHTEISEHQSPTYITYGGFHGLGSMTLRSAHPLKENSEYSVVVSTVGNRGGEYIEGKYDFTVAEDGEILKKKEKKAWWNPF